ncbi:hypothetical protein [Nocardia sp. NPDC058705]|uniref:DUF7373 family lipoprotein n=1 Tax=Nocardia sp. NPDC058705 TaxID=3346609 RepID=UPI00369DB8AA
MKLRTRLLMLALVGALATAGCAATVTGHALPGMFPVDLAKLKLGSYSPEPTPFGLRDFADASDVRRLEAQRMLNYMIPTTDVDPDIGELTGVKTFTSPSDPFTAEALPEQYRAALTDNKLLAGTYVVRTNGSPRRLEKLLMMVLRFPTDQAARASGDQMFEVSRRDAAHTFTVDGHPNARASSKDWSAGIAYVTKGPYLVVANYGLPQPDETTVKSHVKKALDLQLAKMSELSPTPFEDVLDVPFDPDGIMRRALPAASDYTDPFGNDLDFYAYGPSGQLQYERNSALMKQAFADTGVDLIGRRAGIVYRAKDLESAFRLQTALTTLAKNDEVVAAPPGLPDARCLRLYEPDPLRKYDLMCAVVRGRYVGVVVAKSKLGATVNPGLHERAAAQYTVLAKSE